MTKLTGPQKLFLDQFIDDCMHHVRIIMTMSRAPLPKSLLSLVACMCEYVKLYKELDTNAIYEGLKAFGWDAT